jgi:hypothetical protein
MRLGYSNKNKILSEYQRINSHYPTKLIFGIGIHAGFFSEINNMVIAMVYCLHHKIKFNLHSSNANFRLGKGWQDYFLPFCPEVENRLLDKYNLRYRIDYKTDFTKPRRMYRKIKYAFLILYTKKISGTDYLTFDLWDEICNRKLETNYYSLPELGISGDLRHACNRILQFVWRYNPGTRQRIDSLINNLDLPAEYIGFQIRRGDKSEENDFVQLEKYVNEAEKRTEIRNAFIFTDDYCVITQLRHNYPQWKIYTLCGENETGYTFNSFYNQDRKLIYNGITVLMANIEILRQSELFFGTFSANPSMFLGMIMDRDKTISLDVPWQVWYGKSVIGIQ